MIEIEETVGFIGYNKRLHLSKEDAIWSFIDPIVRDQEYHTRVRSIKIFREKLIELLQLLGECKEEE